MHKVNNFISTHSVIKKFILCRTTAKYINVYARNNKYILGEQVLSVNINCQCCYQENVS